MKNRKGWVLLALATFLVSASGWGTECKFFRVGYLDGEGPENVTITSNESGQTFLEFDTVQGKAYVIEATDSFCPPAWNAVWSLTGDGQRATWLSTSRRWSRTYAGLDYNARPSGQQTSDGGYIVAGYKESVSGGNTDVFLMKTDAQGNELWSKTFGGDRNDEAYSVQQTADGGYIVAGSTEKVYAEGWWDAYLIKTDPEGNEVWSSTFGGSEYDYAHSVQQTSDGGYVVAGTTFSYGAGGGDVYLVKTDPNGNVDKTGWSKTFGGSGYDIGYSVQQTSDGGYIVVGISDSFGTGEYHFQVYLIKTDVQGNEVWSRTFGAVSTTPFDVQQTSDGGYIVAANNGPDACLIKTDANGEIEKGKGWTKTFGSGGAHSVQQTSDGGYIVAGTRSWLGPGPCDVYLIKTDANGDEVWSKTFGGSLDDGAHSVQQTTDGGYVVAGSTERETSGLWYRDVYLIKTDANGDAGDRGWSKTFGGTETDGARSVQQTTDGGYIVAGTTWSFGAEGSDAYLIKADESGGEVWNKAFGGTADDEAHSVQQTAEGGYIVAGTTSSLGAGEEDIYLVRADSSGNELWSKAFGGSSRDCGYSVRQTAGGGYIVAGVTESFGAGGDVYLIKTDADGNEVWYRTLGGTEYDEARSVRQTADGGYIVAGTTYSFGAGGSDVYLVKTDETGSEVWYRTFGGTEYEEAYSVQQTADGGYVVAGLSGGNDVYLIKTDGSGNEVWSKTFGGSSVDYGYSVHQTTDGGYIVAGTTESFGAGETDVYVIRTDAEGNEVWSKTFGGTEYEEAYSVRQTLDGGYIVAGTSCCSGAGAWDMYLLKIDQFANTPLPK